MEFRPAKRVMKINRRQLEQAIIEYVGASDRADIILTLNTKSGILDEVIVIDTVTEV